MTTSGRVYDDFVRLLFLYVYHETSIFTILAGELHEESEQFRFWRTARLENLVCEAFRSSSFSV